MEYLKLLKLLYLADRECLGVDGNTITGDSVLAMPNGPVLSAIYDLIRGKAPRTDDWHRYIKTEGKYVFIAEDPKTLDLYRFEKEIIERIALEYREKNAEFLVDLTHTFPEWKKYEELLHSKSKDSYPIFIEDILEGLEKSDMIERVKRNIEDEEFHHELFQNDVKRR